MPTGRRTRWFDFEALEVYNIPTRTLLQSNQLNLLALTPLTREGRAQENLDEMIERLRAGERKDALSMGMLIATEVLTESQERNWLERKLDMLYSELEHTWGYQKILEKGRTEGLHEGEQRGILKGEQKGRLEGLSEGLQERLFTIVELRFPELLSDAQQAVPQITDPDLLRQVGDQLRIISKLEEARRLLLSTSKNQRMPSEQN